MLQAKQLKRDSSRLETAVRLDENCIESNRSSDYLYALLSRKTFYHRMYRGLKEEENLKEKEAAHWKVTVIQESNNLEYTGIIYTNFESLQIIAAFSIPDPINLTEYLSSTQFFHQRDLAFKLIKRAIDLTIENQLPLQLSFTGFSLGGLLAQLSFFYCKINQDLNMISVNSVVFDSPGSKELMEKMQQSRLPSTKFDLSQSDLDCVGYVVYPNIFNTYDQHVGILFYLGELGAHQLSYTHDIDTIADILKKQSSNHLFCHYLTSWPTEYSNDISYSIEKWIGKQFQDANTDKKDYQPRLKTNVIGFCNVPFCVDDFVSRKSKEDKDLIEMIEGSLSEEGTCTISGVTFSGMPGVGKSQLSFYFAHHKKRKYDYYIRYIDAETSTSMMGAFRSFLKILLIDEDAVDSFDPKKIEEVLIKILPSIPKSLFIFDNVEDEASISPWLDIFSWHDVLITSRSRTWTRVRMIIPLDVFNTHEQEAVVNFILNIINKKYGGSETCESAKQLAKELGWFALAIGQAVHTIRDSSTVLEYLDDYQRSKKARKELLSQKVFTKDVYKSTVFTTWDVSIEKVEKVAPGARDLLNMCAYLYADAIPKALFTDCFNNFISIKNAIPDSTLMDVVDGQQKKDSFKIHRLLQEVIRIQLFEENKAEDVINRLFTLLNRYFAYERNKIESVRICQIYLAHVESLIFHAIEDVGLSNLSTVDAATLFLKVGSYYHIECRNYKLGVQYFKKGFKIVKNIASKYSVECCVSEEILLSFNEMDIPNFHEIDLLNNDQLKLLIADIFCLLSIHFHHIGKDVSGLLQQIELIRKSLSIEETNFPVLYLANGYIAFQNGYLSSQNDKNDSSLLEAKTCFLESEKYFKILISVTDKKEENFLPDRAHTFHALGTVYYFLEKYKESECFFKKSLEEKIKLYGENNIHAARSRDKLGTALVKLGLFKEALEEYGKARAIQIKVLPEGHAEIKETEEHISATNTF